MNTGMIEIRDCDVRHCKFCNGEIAWLRNREGRPYPVNVDYAIEGQRATFKTNFHRCAQRAAATVAIPSKAPAKYATPAKDTKAAKKAAMQAYVEAANPAQLVEMLIVIFNRQTDSEQEMNSTSDANSRGFSGFDADILSSICKRRMVSKILSEKEEPLVRRKMLRYAVQLDGAMRAGEWTPTVDMAVAA